MNNATDISPQQFGKVAVLMGGLSAEREISLLTGEAVLQALLRSGVDAQGVDVGSDIVTQLEHLDVDRVFIALHGRGGEDGQIQGMLQVMGIPYTGSDVLGSALSMDKLRCKQLWQSAGLATPGWRELLAASDLQTVPELGFPLMVKPAHEGSSIGMSKVDRAEQLEDAWGLAHQYDNSVIAEQFIDGDEYTVAILHGRALPAIKLETRNVFYDFDAKYESDDTQYICPCGLSATEEEALQSLAIQAFNVVGASGWGRVDLMRDEAGKPWLIEVNTVPGMTSHSLVPMAARAAGIDFDELVVEILATSKTVDAKSFGRNGAAQ